MPMHSPRAPRLALFGLVLLVTAGFVFSLPSVAASPVGSSTPLPTLGTWSELPVDAAPLSAGHALGDVAPSTPLSASIVFQTRNPTEVESIIQNEENPTSTDYGRYLTPSIYNSEFGPEAADVASLTLYLSGHGITVTQPAGGAYDLTGPASAFDSAFGTTLATYAYQGGTAMAPLTPVGLPSSLAPSVASVVGLNTFIRPSNFRVAPSAIIDNGRAAAAPRNPQATVTVSINSPFYSLYGGTTPIFIPPTGVPLTITASAPGVTCPCTWTWTWGDGATVQGTSAAGTDSDVETHTYTQAFNQFTAAADFSVSVTDSATNSGTLAADLVVGLSSSWMQTAYNETPLLQQGQSGAGTTIGLDEECDPSFDINGTSVYTSEVDHFSATMGLPVPSLSYIGAGATDCWGTEGESGWSGETMLDMEWAHSMAPNATIQVYFGNNGITDIAGGDQYWANNLADGVFLASNSWGIDELTADHIFDPIWAQAAAEGITLFSSSGDCGAETPAEPGTLATGLNVSYPASDPDGVGVGGTIVQTNTFGQWVNEWVWNSTAFVANDTCSNNYGTGGGWSTLYTQPSYQQGMTGAGWVPPPTDPNGRGVPDVSMDAATWVELWYDGEWVPEGGTSLASPMWAASSAVVLNAIGDGQRPAGLLDNQIYTLGLSLDYPSAFNDVTSGTNADPLGYTATVGWDPCTGWGSPILNHWPSLIGGITPTWYGVSGYVLDAATLAPIAGASVTSGAAAATTTGAGLYVLYFPAGSYSLLASAAGYNSNTLGVLVNATDQTDLNITLTATSSGTPVNVTGYLLTQTNLSIKDGLVQTLSGPTTGSSGTTANGGWTLILLPGSYLIEGSAPGWNSTTISLTVAATPISDVIIALDYARVTVSGEVLSALGKVPIADAKVVGFNLVNSTGTTNDLGQFWIHLPFGNASVTAEADAYEFQTVQTYVDRGGTSGVLIYLTPAEQTANQVVLTVHVFPTSLTGTGQPEIVMGSSATVVVFANNSVTGKPQTGMLLILSDGNGGTFLPADLNTGNGLTGPVGEAQTTFTAPVQPTGRTDSITASVATTGWSGEGVFSYWLSRQSNNCGTSCSYVVFGAVVNDAGVGIPDASVQIENAGGGAVGTATTNALGNYKITLENGSYKATPSGSGYNPGSAVAFTVAGQGLEVDLVLTPVTIAGFTYGFQTVFTFQWWAPFPFLGLAAFLGILAVFRFFRPEKLTEDDAPVVAAPAAALPAGPPPGAGAPPLPADTPPAPVFPSPFDNAENPPPPASEGGEPEQPWTITPAPPKEPEEPPAPPESGDADAGPAPEGDDMGSTPSDEPPPPPPQ